MPYFVYECRLCSVIRNVRRPVDQRDEELECLECDGPMERVFTPTANLQIPEHFKHLQSQFLPPKGDKAWEYLGRDDRSHAAPVQDDGLKGHLVERLGG